jgi:hypothetical protein
MHARTHAHTRDRGYQRKGAGRAQDILTANKKAVSNEGVVKIAARKSKDTTLVRLFFLACVGTAKVLPY